VASTRLIPAMTVSLGEGALASDRGRLLAATFVMGTFAVCLIRLVGFVQANAVDLLYEDQWDFLRPLFEGRGP
jgi:hypothetical protein